MIYGNRDLGINHIITRKNHTCYGMGLGIIILDDVYPGFPGDVRNASAYPFTGLGPCGGWVAPGRHPRPVCRHRPPVLR